MTMPEKNIIAAIFFAVIGIGYGLVASEMPDRAAIGVPGPAFLPNLIAGIVVFLSVALLIKGIAGLKDSQQATPGYAIPVTAVGLIAGFAVFLFSLPYLGFLFAGVPFFAGLMIMCKSRRWLHIIIGAIVIPVFLFYLFRDGFHILLPHALWM